MAKASRTSTQNLSMWILRHPADLGPDGLPDAVPPGACTPALGQCRDDGEPAPPLVRLRGGLRRELDEGPASATSTRSTPSYRREPDPDVPAVGRAGMPYGVGDQLGEQQLGRFGRVSAGLPLGELLAEQGAACPGVRWLQGSSQKISSA